MGSNLIRDKSLSFAIRSVEVYKDLQSQKEFVISRQFLRSATAVGAAVRESEYAESTKDFVHKLSIGLKEANETLYWLEILDKTGYLESSVSLSCKEDAIELIKILTSIITTSKSKLK